jgi:hypothetical protein
MATSVVYLIRKLKCSKSQPLDLSYTIQLASLHYISQRLLLLLLLLRTCCPIRYMNSTHIALRWLEEARSPCAVKIHERSNYSTLPFPPCPF